MNDGYHTCEKRQWFPVRSISDTLHSWLNENSSSEDRRGDTYLQAALNNDAAAVCYCEPAELSLWLSFSFFVFVFVFVFAKKSKVLASSFE